MPKFAWEGRTKGGKIQKGVMEANNADAVANKLRSQDIQPTEGSIKPAGFDLNMEIPGLGQKVTDKDIIVFTRQFATMIDAGLPLVQCLDLLATESENKTFQKVLTEIKNTVESGSTFADALAKHPKVFTNLYVQMVRAGEVGGILDTILNRLALSMEKAARLKKQIKSALTYPLVTISVAIVITAVMLIFVVPVFEKMFNDMGATLPTFTQYIVNASRWLVKEYGAIYIAVVVGGLIAAFVTINARPQGQLALHTFYLRIPVLGDVIRKSAVASFTRTLSTLISSGVPIMDGLEIVARVSGNRVVEGELNRIRAAIAEGKNLSEPMRDSKIFPHLVVQMIGVGEQTGALDTMLAKIADFYEEEVDDAVAALTSMLEPMIMIFLSVVVGGIVISLYLPIFSLASNIGA